MVNEVNENKNQDLEKILDFPLPISHGRYDNLEDYFFSSCDDALPAIIGGSIVGGIGTIIAVSYGILKRNEDMGAKIAISSIIGTPIAFVLYRFSKNLFKHIKSRYNYKKAPKTTRELMQYCKNKKINEVKIIRWEDFDLHPFLGQDYEGLVYYGKDNKGKYNKIFSMGGITNNICGLEVISLGFDPSSEETKYLQLAGFHKKILEKEGIKVDIKNNC